MQEKNKRCVHTRESDREKQRECVCLSMCVCVCDFLQTINQPQMSANRKLYLIKVQREMGRDPILHSTGPSPASSEELTSLTLYPFTPESNADYYQSFSIPTCCTSCTFFFFSIGAVDGIHLNIEPLFERGNVIIVCCRIQ